MNALELFRAGAGYIEIAAHFQTTEAVIERVIHRLRQAERMQDRARAASMKQDAIAMMKAKERRISTRDRLREIRSAHV